MRRIDEQAFARLNGANLMYVEDAARRLRNILAERYANFHVAVRHFEGLHAHDAVAETDSDAEAFIHLPIEGLPCRARIRCVVRHVHANAVSIWLRCAVRSPPCKRASLPGRLWSFAPTRSVRIRECIAADRQQCRWSFAAGFAASQPAPTSERDRLHMGCCN